MPSFFELYNKYTKNTEPPPNFHAWCAIGAISALLGKKCFIPQGHFTVYPNLYIIIVGDPGTRKSTSLNIAKGLVKLVEKVPLAPESATREALIDDMSKNRVAIEFNGQDISYWQSSAFVGELEQFLGGKHINHQMVGFLTAIWDEPEFKERTRKGGEVKIRNPYFTMLACCTPEWMNTKLKQDVISDGFSRRAIFNLENELNCFNPWPVSTEEEIACLKELQRESERMFALCGPFIFTKEARKHWDAEYIKIRDEAKNFSTKVQHYFSSKHILAQKIAMCLSAATRNDRIIDSECLKTAFKFLATSEASLDTVFSGVGRNELKSLSDKVYNFIETAGEAGTTKAKIIAQFYDDANLVEITELLSMLTESDRVRLESVSVSSPPIYRVEKARKRSQGQNLLELASRIVLTKEQPSEDLKGAAITRLVDPVTAQLLTRSKERATEQQSGILYRGKRKELLRDDDSPSNSED